METKFGQLFTEAELAEIRKQFAYVDRDRNEDARLFFDNAGGSLRLTAAEKAFYDADLMPDASGIPTVSRLNLRSSRTGRVRISA